jgi:hypothetical protein
MELFDFLRFGRGGAQLGAGEDGGGGEGAQGAKNRGTAAGGVRSRGAVGLLGSVWGKKKREMETVAPKDKVVVELKRCSAQGRKQVK